jgi:hypothetical protein
VPFWKLTEGAPHALNRDHLMVDMTVPGVLRGGPLDGDQLDIGAPVSTGMVREFDTHPYRASADHWTGPDGVRRTVWNFRLSPMTSPDSRSTP